MRPPKVGRKRKETAAAEEESEESEGGEEEQQDVYAAQLEAYKRSLTQLADKRRVNESQAEAAAIKQHEWTDKVAKIARGFEHAVPVLPVGDSLLEPFWPQGLGSNRGFHSALDAIWAVHVFQQEGLEAALLVCGVSVVSAASDGFACFFRLTPMSFMTLWYGFFL